ncbi:MAG: chloride channel protein [Chloroflexi bacterium]|nr:chloride channel protein [Chloroflexota bacterium]
MTRARFLRVVRRRVRTAAYLRKWVVLGALIGVISGLGAALFFVALDVGSRFFLGVLAGFVPASPLGEGARPITDALRPWALPLVVGLGGLISGVIVFRLAPEAEGHGTDAAIAAFHHGPKRIRARIPLIKLVASAMTIGSGGSGGREGPTAQIGAGFGSFLARLLDLDARDARIAVSTGIGAGIGAIFRAPLGGAVLAAEIPYRDDVESDALVPAFVGSIVAFSIFGAIIGFDPIFGRVAGAGFTDPRQLLYYALIGLAAGVVGRLYIASFYGFTRWFGRWSLPRALRPAVAGFAVGCLGLALPGVLGTGYGWVQAGLDRTTLLGLPLWVVLALPFAKILATSLSIGSGGSGGIFGPGMVIGGLLGAGIWRLLEPVAPAVPLDPSPFVIVAMMALFGSVARAPLAVMLMVAEMTDSLAMLAPAMLAIGIATLVVGDRSIYASQLRSRAESAAHRFRFALPLMAAIPAGDAARVPRAVVTLDDSTMSVRARLVRAGVPGAPVVDRAGSVLGSIDVVALETAADGSTIGDLDLAGSTIPADGALDDALAILTDAHRSWAPVVADDRLVGILSIRDIVAAYRRALAGNVQRVRGVDGGGSLVDAEIGPSSTLVGSSVAAVPWPRQAILVSVTRGEEVIVPRGDLVLEAGDRLTAFATPAAREALEGLLASRIAAAAPEA